MPSSRRNFVKQVATGGGLLLSGQASQAAAPCATAGPTAKPLNLLLVFPDEMRPRPRVSCARIRC